MKVAVLVSGGVDSAVALHLLKEQGHDLTAFYLKIWLEDELSYLGSCPWHEDLSYVQAVCAQLNVPLEVVSMQQAYHARVVTYMLEEIRAGRTPNPDIMCNTQVKFGAFLDAIEQSGRSFDKIATGHYARILTDGDRHGLGCAPDMVKDQTYFLARLSQEQLARALFPIGHLDKGRVRAMAHEICLPNMDRKDSQGICFLGKFKFVDFLRYHVGEEKGPLLAWETGEVLGEHKGFWFYTIGQRRGTGLSGGPWYVVAKNPGKNIVYLSKNYYAADKKRDLFYIDGAYWFSGKAPANDTNLTVKLRHGPARHSCSVSTGNNGIACVALAERDQGIAPGQCAVFYTGDRCLGSGIIADTV